jgi:oligopeptidase B
MPSTSRARKVYRILVKDLATGEVLPEPVESAPATSPGRRIRAGCSGSGATTTAARPRSSPPGARRGEDDVLVYEEPDDGFFLGVGTTADDAYIVIGAGNQETSEALADPGRPTHRRARGGRAAHEGLRYDVEHWDGRFVIRTNADGAVDFKLMRRRWPTPRAAATGATGRPHEPGRSDRRHGAFKDHLVRLERENANDRIVVRAAPAPSTPSPSTRRPTRSPRRRLRVRHHRHALRLSVADHAAAVVRLRHGEPRAHPAQDPGNPLRPRPGRYETRRLYARRPTAREVPITVLMRADTPLDGSAPLLLYGYGAYGIPMEPHFSIRNSVAGRSRLDLGHAHVRGGSDKGWGWFLDGRGAEEDQHLHRLHRLRRAPDRRGLWPGGRIVAYGGSAGGMLMGAIANLRPDLWAGIIAAVPFVDVLNTMSDTSLPLTPPEWPEWGNPLEDPAAYDLHRQLQPL